MKIQAQSTASRRRGVKCATPLSQDYRGGNFVGTCLLLGGTSFLEFCRVISDKFALIEVLVMRHLGYITRVLFQLVPFIARVSIGIEPFHRAPNWPRFSSRSPDCGDCVC